MNYERIIINWGKRDQILALVECISEFSLATKLHLKKCDKMTHHMNQKYDYLIYHKTKGNFASSAHAQVQSSRT